MITRSYIPERALHDANLTHTERVVFGCIFGFLERGKRVDLSTQSLAKVARIGDRQLRRCIAKLVDLKYLELDGTKFEREYRIVTNSVLLVDSGEDKKNETDIDDRLETETDIDDRRNGHLGHRNGHLCPRNGHLDPPTLYIEERSNKDKYTHTHVLNTKKDQDHDLLEIQKALESVEPVEQEIDVPYANDVLFINTGKKPHPRQRDVWLTDQERKDISRVYAEYGLSQQDALRALQRCSEQNSVEASRGRDPRVKHANWLHGWVLHEMLKEKKLAEDLKRSKSYAPQAPIPQPKTFKKHDWEKENSDQHPECVKNEQKHT